MSKLNWGAVRDLVNSDSLLTKTGQPFRVVAVSAHMLTVKVSTGKEYPILRETLEQAFVRVDAGLILNGPGDYKKYIADERPAYAWAILKHLELLGK